MKHGCFLRGKERLLLYLSNDFGFFIDNGMVNMKQSEWDIWVSTESITNRLPVSFNLPQPQCH